MSGVGRAPGPWSPPAPGRSERPVAVLRLTGADALRVLHGQTSQAIQPAARPGDRLLTCCITPTARLRALAQVLVEENGAWLLIEAGDPAGVRLALDRVLFPADAVTLGPLQPALLVRRVGTAGDAEAGAGAGAGAGPGRWQPLCDGASPEQGGWRFDDGSVLLPLPAHSSDAGASSAAALALLPAELAALPPLGADALELERIRRGEPALPGEIHDDHNPFELGLADRVSLTKGCYVGQETLARLATYDGVRQQLRRWWLPAGDTSGGAAAGAAPEPGETLLDAAGERAGRISSVLAVQGGWVGLALVRRVALAADQLLRAGGEAVAVSEPAGFVAPPVGAGGTGGAGSAGPS